MPCITLQPGLGGTLNQGAVIHGARKCMATPVPLQRLQQRVPCFATPSLEQVLFLHPSVIRPAVVCHGLPQGPGGAPSQPAGDQQATPKDEVDDFEPLTPEEDYVVPGTMTEAMNGNTRLGKAIKAACSELNQLNQLEQNNLQQADELLKKLGFKSSLISAQLPSVPASDDDDDEELEE